MKLVELRGSKSLRALNAFSALMLGLKMLPAYMGESFETFFARVDEMPLDDKERLIRQAVLFVNLEKEEVEALLSFVLDPNGVPYSAENVKTLGPKQLAEAIIAVCLEVAKIKIDLVSDAEKKK